MILLTKFATLLLSYHARASAASMGIQDASYFNDASRWLCDKRTTREAGSLRSTCTEMCLRRGRFAQPAASTTLGPDAMSVQPRNTRTERLHVRLTADEAAHITASAAKRGMPIPDFVRARLLRGSGRTTIVARRTLARDTAETVRQLSAIVTELRHLAEVVQTRGLVASSRLDDCLARVCDVIGRCKP